MTAITQELPLHSSAGGGVVDWGDKTPGPEFKLYVDTCVLVFVFVLPRDGDGLVRNTRPHVRKVTGDIARGCRGCRDCKVGGMSLGNR